MKKRVLFLLTLSPLLAGLSSCAQQSVAQTKLLFGTHEYLTVSETTSVSHMSKLEDESVLESMIQNKENFLLLVLGDAHLTCSCWVDFHANNIVRYQKETNVLFYYLYSGELSNAHGLSIGSNKATLGIFNNGALAAENSDADENSDFVKDYSAFKSWMKERLVLPRVYFLTREQLNEKYNGDEAFTIYFSRQTCSDCLYLQKNEYSTWYFGHETGVQDSFVIDMDGVGIGAIEVDGKIYHRSSAEDANVYQKAAEAQYEAFKEEYGLLYSADNPAGYLDGAVPTLYHINPEGNGKKTGDVIDMAATFFNETLNEDSLITASYFEESHLALEALSWLSHSSLETKILVGKKISGTNLRDGLAVYENPMVDAFLTAAVGTVK